MAARTRNKKNIGMPIMYLLVGLYFFSSVILSEAKDPLAIV